jgi:hypothetical protein
MLDLLRHNEHLVSELVKVTIGNVLELEISFPLLLGHLFSHLLLVIVPHDAGGPPCLCLQGHKDARLAITLFVG